MGVYIKGMEMPKSCGNCFFDTHCDNWRLRNWGAPPPDDCPLVPVPPHGRLIDADKMKESIRKQAEFVRLIGGEFAEIAEALETGFLQEIDNAPTVIPEEEGE